MELFILSIRRLKITNFALLHSDDLAIRSTKFREPSVKAAVQAIIQDDARDVNSLDDAIIYARDVHCAGSADY